MSGRSISVVTFDGDGTLWDSDLVMRHALKEALAEFQQARPGPFSRSLTVKRLTEVREGLVSEMKQRPTTPALEAIRLASFERIVEESGEPDPGLARRLSDVYFHHRWAPFRCFPDVLPTFDRLQGKYRLGLLTNGNTDPEKCELEGRFDFVVTAQSHGVEKPDSRYFQVALEFAGCNSEEMMHVGDSLDDDVRGAQQEGILAVWVNRRGRSHGGGASPDYEIATLEQLPGFIDDVNK